MLEANASVSIPQAVWIACNHEISPFKGGKVYVSIPQAVWIACNDALGSGRPHTAEFQYRKRYGLHAIEKPMRVIRIRGVSIPQAVWIACNYKIFVFLLPSDEFQYRKRYGLHAIRIMYEIVFNKFCFNTASGMDCMQYCLPEALETVSPKTEFLTMTPFSRFFPK